MVLQQISVAQFIDTYKAYKEARDLDIIVMRERGDTFQVIADKYFITRQRAQQIYQASKRAQSERVAP